MPNRYVLAAPLHPPAQQHTWPGPTGPGPGSGPRSWPPPGRRPGHVAGARTTPRASTLVSLSRLMPVGWNSHCEYRTRWPWVRANAGHSKNHRNRAASPQPHVVVVDGCDDQTPHHSTTETGGRRRRPPPSAGPGPGRRRSPVARPAGTPRTGRGPPVGHGRDGRARPAPPGPAQLGRGHGRVGAEGHGGEPEGVGDVGQRPRHGQRGGDGPQVGAPAGHRPGRRGRRPPTTRTGRRPTATATARRTAPPSRPARCTSRARVGRAGRSTVWLPMGLASEN